MIHRAALIVEDGPDKAQLLLEGREKVHDLFQMALVQKAVFTVEWDKEPRIELTMDDSMASVVGDLDLRPVIDMLMDLGYDVVEDES